MFKFFIGVLIGYLVVTYDVIPKITQSFSDSCNVIGINVHFPITRDTRLQLSAKIVFCTPVLRTVPESGPEASESTFAPPNEQQMTFQNR